MPETPSSKEGVSEAKSKFQRGKELVTGLIKNNPIARAARGNTAVVSTRAPKKFDSYKDSPQYKMTQEANKSFKKDSPKPSPAK